MGDKISSKNAHYPKRHASGWKDARLVTVDNSFARVTIEGENRRLEIHLWKYLSEMVSQHAMATTVRKVKQENRLRRQNQSQGTRKHMASLSRALVSR